VNIDLAPAEDSAAPVTIPRLLSSQTLIALLGISRATLYVWLQEEGFPEPVRLSSKSKRWRADQVAAWIASRSAGRCRPKPRSRQTA
jgi:predicted DNA-binding transcriptional regulator AlpA